MGGTSRVTVDKTVGMAGPSNAARDARLIQASIELEGLETGISVRLATKLIAASADQCERELKTAGGFLRSVEVSRPKLVSLLFALPKYVSIDALALPIEAVTPVASDIHNVEPNMCKDETTVSIADDRRMGHRVQQRRPTKQSRPGMD